MELWDIYDKNRQKTGKIHERSKTISEGDYHLVVQVWIRNSKGEFLISKRHPNKPHPNLWECPGGSVLKDETSLEGAMREVKEEIGVELPEKNGELIRSERRDEFNDFYDAWLFHHDFDITETTLQDDEVSDAKWVTIEEIERIYKNGDLIWTLSYFKSIFAYSDC